MVLINNHFDYRIIGNTLDDACGEVFDKVARILNLGFPGGPIIDKLAKEGDSKKYKFSRPMLDQDNFNFSFSGLKTSLRYTLEAMEKTSVEVQMSDLCASYQQAVVDALARKSRAALQLGNYRSLGLSGGVANNGLLRKTMGLEAHRKQIPFFAARLEHTGDNAAMIAFAGFVDTARVMAGGFDLKIEPGLGL